MKNSVLSTAVFFCLLAFNPAAHAQTAQIINGGNPRPQIINGGNPRPSAVTSAPSPSTSILPAWVQTVLTVLHLM